MENEIQAWVAELSDGQLLITVNGENVWVASRRFTGDTWGPPVKANPA